MLPPGTAWTPRHSLPPPSPPHPPRHHVLKALASLRLTSIPASSCPPPCSPPTPLLSPPSPILPPPSPLIPPPSPLPPSSSRNPRKDQIHKCMYTAKEPGRAGSYKARCATTGVAVSTLDSEYPLEILVAGSNPAGGGSDSSQTGCTKYTSGLRQFSQRAPSISSSRRTTLDHSQKAEKVWFTEARLGRRGQKATGDEIALSNKKTKSLADKLCR